MSFVCLNSNSRASLFTFRSQKVEKQTLNFNSTTMHLESSLESGVILHANGQYLTNSFYHFNFSSSNLVNDAAVVCLNGCIRMFGILTCCIIRYPVAKCVRMVHVMCRHHHNHLGSISICNRSIPVHREKNEIAKKSIENHISQKQ